MTPYEIISYIFKHNPQAIVALLRKYGVNTTVIAPSETVVMQVLEQNGELALVDLFEAYWQIIERAKQLGVSFDGAFYPTPDGKAPAAETSDKKSGWDKFTQIFGLITGGVGSATSLINAVKAPKQTAQPTTEAAQKQTNTLLIVGVAVVVVVVLIGIVLKIKK